MGLCSGSSSGKIFNYHRIFLKMTDFSKNKQKHPVGKDKFPVGSSYKHVPVFYVTYI